jgi:2-polyprenyl-3-methyl-5-hydroxy-6-metoxy-1,4-benzoquinol methylase
MTLSAARMRAAEASRGASNLKIHSAILAAIEEFELGGSVLDFGSGNGSLTRKLQDSSRFDDITAVDLMPPASHVESVNWLCADLNHALPLQNQSFEVVVAAEVIEHLENPRFTFREIYRLLKPGGIAIITTPNNESLAVDPVAAGARPLRCVR